MTPWTSRRQDQEFWDYAPNQVASEPLLVPGIKDCERTGPQIRGTGDKRKQQGKDEKTSINICALGALSYIPYPPSYWKILATSTSPLVSRVCRSHRSEDIASLRLLLTPKTLPNPKPSHGTVPQTAAGAGSDPALGRADGSDGFLWPIPNFVWSLSNSL